MFSFDDLRPLRTIDGDLVPCPVVGCTKRVPLQRRTFRRSNEYRCEAHRLFIGRSTFEYETDADNLLRTVAEDQELLAAIRRLKRESRMTRERSEDAMTWNVFRHLETSGRLAAWVASLTGRVPTSSKVHYWSFDASTGATWAPLAAARSEFGELDGRGSEPDLVIVTDDAHIWVEAKLGSSNDTAPSDVNGAESRYVAGASAWYASVVSSPFRVVAVEERRYELLRLWLLGSWAAACAGKRFFLVNLVRKGHEEGVPSFVEHHFKQDASRLVRRTTWESLRSGIDAAPNHSPADTALLRYMQGKTLGYDARGRLVRAFSSERHA